MVAIQVPSDSVGGSTDNPVRTIGKPWENHGKMVVFMGFCGFYGSYRLAKVDISMESSTMFHGKTYGKTVSMAIFNSYVSLPEGALKKIEQVHIAAIYN